MNTERLLRARAIMERVRDQQKPFDLADWFEHPFDRPDDCNTAACFFGWCCRDKQFQSEGLTVVLGMPEFRAGPANRRRKYVGLPACMHFFEISEFRTRFLTLPEAYYRGVKVTPQDVIEHLDLILAGYDF